MEKVDYNKAIINFEKEASTRTTFSYDPVSNKVYDVSKIEESKELYNAYGNGKDPLYIISTTNNITINSIMTPRTHIWIYKIKKRRHF